MPNFECKRCNFEKFYEPMKSPNACPQCGSKWYRLRYIKEAPKKTKFVNIAFDENPRWSWSMGVNIQDIPEMTKKYPDRVYHPKTGQLLVRNRPHKKQLIREHNMEELS